MSFIQLGAYIEVTSLTMSLKKSAAISQQQTTNYRYEGKNFIILLDWNIEPID